MCLDCARLDRRKFLRYAASGLTAAALATSSGLFSPSFAATTLSADEALAKLKEGNKKYLTDPQSCLPNAAGTRSAIANGQSPWATILTCSDSRVVPEIVFGGLDLCELFVARNAGNIANTDVLGTIEYGAEHLGSPLIVVMGHERCGAVAAACDVVAKKAKLPGNIKTMVDSIVPAAKSQFGKPGDFLDNTVRENARRNAEIVGKSEIIHHLVHEGRVKIVYARYDLDSGMVDFLG